MFIGRERELEALEMLYASGKFEFAVIYGRRRVGKTTLINEFIRGKKAVYFTGIESSAAQNLENLSRLIMESEGIEAAAAFRTMQDAMEYLFRRAEKERLIFVMDEYPYAARAFSELASVLQLLIDRYKDRSRLMLILCGSSMSYMEDEVLAYKAPLYGRRTAQMKILPFDFAHARRCIPHFAPEEQALIYGIAGGTPQYLLQMDDTKSAAENICRTFLKPSSALYEEPENLLKQEVREPALYNAVITAIAQGASRLTTIADKTGVSTGLAAVYLKNLIGLGLVRKESPYGEKASKRSIYIIEDNMFRFWYRFVPGNESLIARGLAELAYRRIEPYLNDYMGRIFEDICREYLWELLAAGETPIDFTDLGRWWGTDPKTKSQTEIDIMGERDKHSALFGECKWTNEKVGLSVLETLRGRSNLFSYEKKHLYLFAKTGFTQGCIEAAEEMGNVTLVTYADILKRLDKK